MTVMPIVLWPDPRLNETCAPVDEITDRIATLVADMFDTMYAAPGRGLAAPQVGEMIRLFVTDFTWKDKHRDPRVFINPVLTERSTTLAEVDEGCLSIPRVMTRIARPDRVRMDWLDLEGRRISEEFKGFAAACVQHELDHLNGIITLDRLSPEARAQAESEYAV